MQGWVQHAKKDVCLLVLLLLFRGPELRPELWHKLCVNGHVQCGEFIFIMIVVSISLEMASRLTMHPLYLKKVNSMSRDTVIPDIFSISKALLTKQTNDRVILFLSIHFFPLILIFTSTFYKLNKRVTPGSIRIQILHTVFKHSLQFFLGEMWYQVIWDTLEEGEGISCMWCLKM